MLFNNNISTHVTATHCYKYPEFQTLYTTIYDRVKFTLYSTATHSYKYPEFHTIYITTVSSSHKEPEGASNVNFTTLWHNSQSMRRLS